MGKHEQYEIESILADINYKGFVTIPLTKLYFLLGRGNRAAGTWRALLDVWEGIGGQRTDLHIAELPHEMLLISKQRVEPLTSWAGE